MRNLVRHLRKGAELSQEQLADRMDVSRQTINSIENGRYTPSLQLAIQLARFFNSTVEEVFCPDVFEPHVCSDACAESAVESAA